MQRGKTKKKWNTGHVLNYGLGVNLSSDFLSLSLSVDSSV